MNHNSPITDTSCSFDTDFSSSPEATFPHLASSSLPVETIDRFFLKMLPFLSNLTFEKEVTYLDFSKKFTLFPSYSEDQSEINNLVHKLSQITSVRFMSVSSLISIQNILHLLPTVEVLVAGKSFFEGLKSITPKPLFTNLRRLYLRSGKLDDIRVQIPLDCKIKHPPATMQGLHRFDNLNPNDWFHSHIIPQSHRESSFSIYPKVSKSSHRPSFCRGIDSEGYDFPPIAILDSGINIKRNDFSQHVTLGKSFAPTGYWKVDNCKSSHGTILAEIIASFFGGEYSAKKSAEPRGRYPQLLIGQIIDSNHKTSASKIIAGLQWAVTNGAKIILLCALSTTFNLEVEREILSTTSQGIIIVVPSSFIASDAALRFPATMGVILRAGTHDPCGSIYVQSGLSAAVSGPECISVSFPKSGFVHNSTDVAIFSSSGSAAFVAAHCALLYAKTQQIAKTERDRFLNAHLLRSLFRQLGLNLRWDEEAIRSFLRFSALSESDIKNLF
ncbi:S8/S53 family peptidase [Patescibacteria group bacterium]|nr:S8/S53 family peptidase [Patescibacteria group bacterium]